MTIASRLAALEASQQRQRARAAAALTDWLDHEHERNPALAAAEAAYLEVLRADPSGGCPGVPPHAVGCLCTPALLAAEAAYLAMIAAAWEIASPEQRTAWDTGERLCR